MRADGCDEDDGVFGVAEGAAGGEVVGGAAGGGGDADAVGLDGGEVFVAAEDFDGGHGWRGGVSSVALSFPNCLRAYELAFGPLSMTISFRI